MMMMTMTTVVNIDEDDHAGTYYKVKDNDS